MAVCLLCRGDAERPLRGAGEGRVRERREERRQERGDHRVRAGYRRADPQGKGRETFFHLLACGK